MLTVCVHLWLQGRVHFQNGIDISKGSIRLFVLYPLLEYSKTVLISTNNVPIVRRSATSSWYPCRKKKLRTVTRRSRLRNGSWRTRWVAAYIPHLIDSTPAALALEIEMFLACDPLCQCSYILIASLYKSHTDNILHFILMHILQKSICYVYL